MKFWTSQTVDRVSEKREKKFLAVTPPGGFMPWFVAVIKNLSIYMNQLQTPLPLCLFQFWNYLDAIIN